METTVVPALIFGLAAAIGWGISGFFDARASKTVGPIIGALLVNCVVTIGYCVLFALFWRNHFIMQSTGCWFAITGGLAIAVGALSYFKGLSIGPVSLVSPMSSSYPLVTALLALGIFRVTLHTQQLLGLGMLIVGIMLATNLIRPRQLKALESRGPLLGLGAALCWGVGYTLLAQGVQRIGWQSATLFELLAMMLGFGICLPFIKDGRVVSRHAIKQASTNKNVLFAGCIALSAALSFNIGLSHEAASGAIVSAMSACYPILTVLLALRHFDESVRVESLAGAVLSVGGAVVLLLG